MRIYEAFIIVPKNVDRDLFVKNCLNNNECAIGTSDGVFRIAKDATTLINEGDGIISTLDFPASYKEMGSKVIVLDLPLFNTPLVFLVGNINNNFRPDEEKQMKLYKKFKNNSGLIELRGKKGIININSKSDEPGGGVINIESNNSNGSEINLKADVINYYVEIAKMIVSNVFEIIIENKSVKEESASLFYKLNQGFQFIDEWANEINQNESLLELKHKNKIVLISETEPLVLGNQITDWLNGFLTELDTIYNTLIVPTPLGPSGTPVNGALMSSTISSYKSKLESLKSKKVFTE
jgi:hypothetical protein